MITNMSDRPGEPERGEPQAARPGHSVMPAWSIWVGAGVLFVVATGSMVLLFALFGAGTPADKIRLEIIKLAGSVVIGTGGAAALLLAARRQRSTELGIVQTERDLAYKEQAAADARHDAIERRATELYTAAAEQLGSDKAPVRLAGLYALERFGQANDEYRQTVVNVLCAYLCMPFSHPDAPEELTEKARTAPEESAQNPLLVEFGPGMAAAAGISLYGKEAQRQELQVRLTAQRILANHLRPDPIGGRDDDFWPGMSLDLTGAVLDHFDMGSCQVDEAYFDHARFLGRTRFEGAHFLRLASFVRAEFVDVAQFAGTYFELVALFTNARFQNEARFVYARFKEKTDFDDALFEGTTSFENTLFEYPARFHHAQFLGSITTFSLAEFEHGARFLETRVRERFHFAGARRRWDMVRSGDIWPEGWTTQAPANDEAGRIDGIDGVWGFVVGKNGDSRVGISTD